MDSADEHPNGYPLGIEAAGMKDIEITDAVSLQLWESQPGGITLTVCSAYECQSADLTPAQALKLAEELQRWAADKI
jgi:hypothetical protein